jgi:hypothetical protein
VISEELLPLPSPATEVSPLSLSMAAVVELLQVDTDACVED